MYHAVTTNTYDSTWKSTRRAQVEFKGLHYAAKLKQFSKTASKLNKDVWDLKLEIPTCFDTVLCHLHSVTLKNKRYTEYNLMQYALSYCEAF